MDDDTDDLVEMMRRVDRMNHEQRAIVGGVIATLQAFDDDDAAGRWLEPDALMEAGNGIEPM